MLQLRVYGEPSAMAAVAQGLAALAGARHVSSVAAGSGGTALVTADVQAEAADAALAIVDRLGVPADDVVFVRLDTIGSVSGAVESIALVWADMVSQARIQARAPGRYYVLMAAAGVVAAFAVIEKSPVLIVGAMAISPDLLPITATVTGIVLRVRGLLGRGLETLVSGLGVTCLVAAAVTGFLNLFSLLPSGFTLGVIPAAQTHVNASTILVALAAGVAGIVAMETRASSAVGVAISVTTVPAAAYLGVGAGIGEFGKSLSALEVLGANVAMMLVGGSCALAIQRALSARRLSASP